MTSPHGKYAKNRGIYRLFVIFILLFAWGCGVKKIIPNDSYLLKSNVVELHTVKQGSNAEKVKESEIKAQILHRENKRVLFDKIPIYLWMYALGTKDGDTAAANQKGWRKKFRDNYGEPPVFIDSNLAALSGDNIHNYLFNKGYFDATVRVKLNLKKRKGKVTYVVNTDGVYRINSFFKQPQDSALMPVLANLEKTEEAFRLWWPLNLEKLNQTRSDLAVLFRNQGYYQMNKESFRFEIDTLQNKKEGAVFLKIDNMSDGRPYRKFKFGNVGLFVECSDVYANNDYPDSLSMSGVKMKLNHYPFEASTLRSMVQFDSGAIYAQTAGEATYRSMTDVGLFSFVDIRYVVDTANCIIYPAIYLKAMDRMSFSFEPQGLYSPQGTSGTNFQTQSQRSFGLAGILAYNNRNVFHNGENFRLSSVTSYEAIFRRDQTRNFLYGFQQGFNASLSLPHFTLLNGFDRLVRTQKRNTVFSLSYQFENNPNFKRSSLPASLTFQFIRNKLSWYYTPLELSFNRNRLDPGFLPRLPQLDQDFVKRVFTDQFISAAKLGLIYSNNRNKPGQTYVFTRAGFETSGNLHRWARSLKSGFNSDSSYNFLGVNYFQYTKVEGEIRLRQTLDELNALALRINSGVVLPYGNSTVVPYDKRYFIGGSNSLRAWRPRRLGPGSTSDTNKSIIDRSGEFIFEVNFEYRFTLFKNFLEGALFMDAGNIWNLNHKGQPANAKGILYPEFWGDDLALNTGIGFRFDFKFFLFRLDWGFPLRDPGKPAGDRWLLAKDNLLNFNQYLFKETAIAIGIGYPF
jgi:outer membrane protein assembly factor BamA